MTIKSIELFEKYISPKVPKNSENVCENLAKGHGLVFEANVWDAFSGEVYITTRLVVGDTVFDGGIGFEEYQWVSLGLCDRDFKEYESKNFLINESQGFADYYNNLYMTLGYLSEKFGIELPNDFDIATNSAELLQAFEVKGNLNADCFIKNLGCVKHVYNLWLPS